MSKRWGASIRGHDFDLQDWREMLKPPFDPWIEMHGSDTVLRSTSLDELTSAEEVRDRVVAHIERLNGTMSVIRRCWPLEFNGVVEITPDGKVHRTFFLQGIFDGRSRVGAISLTIRNGKPEPEPHPRLSEAQSWLAIADGDDLLEDALVYFGRVSAPDTSQHPPTFWLDIYKTLECLMGRFGGEAAFLALDWAPRDDVKRLKQTANWARHARRKFPKPVPATTEKEAKDITSHLLRKAFETARAP